MAVNYTYSAEYQSSSVKTSLEKAFQSCISPAKQQRELTEEDNEDSYAVLQEYFTTSSNSSSDFKRMLGLASASSSKEEQFFRSVTNRSRDTISCNVQLSDLNELSNYIKSEAVDRCKMAAMCKDEERTSKINLSLSALQACICSYGRFEPQTHHQMKIMMAYYLEDSKLKEASLMAVELYCGQAKLDRAKDRFLIDRCHGLFNDISVIENSETRHIKAGIALCTLQHFLPHVSSENRQAFEKKLARLSILSETSSTKVDIPSVPSTKILIDTVKTCCACIAGEHKHQVISQVEGQLLELQTGALDCRRSAQIWLERFVALVTGYSFHDPECKIFLATKKKSPIFEYSDNGMFLPGNVEVTKSEFEQRLTKSMEDFSDIPREIVQIKTKSRKVFNGLANNIIVLEGSSGVGKSELSRKIPEGIFTGHHRSEINLGSVGGKYDILGHGLGILSASPGKFTQSLMSRGKDQPVIIIHELDKPDKQIQNTVATILEFKEPFTDPYFNFPVYLNQAFFIITYNNKDALIDHLKDRINPYTITIPDPTKNGVEKAANKLLRQFLKTLNRDQIHIPANYLSKFLEYVSSDTSYRDVREKAEKFASIIHDRTDGNSSVNSVTGYIMSEFLNEGFISSLDIKPYLHQNKLYEFKKITLQSVFLSAPSVRFKDTITHTYMCNNVKISLSRNLLRFVLIGSCANPYPHSCERIIATDKTKAHILRFETAKEKSNETARSDVYPTVLEFSPILVTDSENNNSIKIFEPMDDDLVRTTNLSIYISECTFRTPPQPEIHFPPLFDDYPNASTYPV
jgi:hypothetical protein